MNRRKILSELLREMWRSTPSTRAKLEAMQARRIEKALDFFRSNTAYFAALGDVPLGQLPRMNKQVMMDHFDELNSAGISKSTAFELARRAERSRDFSPEWNGVTVGLSSGTSGNAGLFLTNDGDKARYAAAVARKLLWPLMRKRGLRPSRRSWPLRAALLFRSDSPLYQSTNSPLVKLRFIDITAADFPQTDDLAAFDPHVILGPPAALELLAQTAAHRLQPERVFSVAEVLEDDVRGRLQRAFKVPVIHQLYQCTEGFLGSTCEHGTLHLHEDMVHIEKSWLNGSSSTVAAPGRRYHPVITDFTRRTQAIVRYELNDILVEGPPCPCGSLFSAVAKIEGRSDDVFELHAANGGVVRLFPDQIRNTLLVASSTPTNFLVEQVGPTSIRISLKLDPSNKAANTQASNRVHQAFQNLLVSRGVRNPSIEQAPWTNPGLERKQRRIVNRMTRKPEPNQTERAPLELTEIT